MLSLFLILSASLPRQILAGERGSQFLPSTGVRPTSIVVTLQPVGGAGRRKERFYFQLSTMNYQLYFWNPDPSGPPQLKGESL